MKIRYVIKYVADMDAAVAFHRDRLGLSMRFASSHWTEFDGGGVTLALHIASPDKPAGGAQIGYHSDDLEAFYAARDQLGVTFTDPPRDQHGAKIARFLDSEGAECSVGG
ncbi:MAG: VOC family protein [Caulobacterales bacterium]|nr:VOC family protein [Caulobacterales bacterium]